MLERRTTYVAWIAWLVGLLWMVAAHVRQTLQPDYWPLLVLLTVALLCAIVGAGVGVWRVCRGTRRLAATGWMLLAMGPFWLWTAQLSYGAWCLRAQRPESDLILRISRPALLAFGEAVAQVLYRERTEGRYVVMFHDGVSDSPQQDVAAMDRHLEAMQELLGKRMRSKVRWVRGSALGVSGRGGLGWALGSSDAAPRKTDELRGVDRHEAAHAILDTLEYEEIGAPLNREPPAILIEGWAEVQSGCSGRTLLERAWNKRQRGLDYSLRDLVSEDLYGDSVEPAYVQGGALVDYILCQFGPQKFLELYMTCRPESFTEDCQRVLGIGVDELDRAYWDYVRQQVDPVGIGGLSYVQLAPSVDESLWREIAANHLAAAERVRQTILSGPLRAQSKISTEYPDPDSPQEAQVGSLELVIDGNRWRHEKLRSQEKDVIVAKPGCSFSFVQCSDDEGRQWLEELSIGTRPVLSHHSRERIVAYGLGDLVWQHYALADADCAFWSASTKPFVHRLERVSRNARDLALVAFENQGEFGGRRSYLGGELYFDPASCWAIRSTSLRIKSENDATIRRDLSFEFRGRENEPPLLRSLEEVRETAGKTHLIRRVTYSYDFSPQIDADDFSPGRYGLTLPRGDPRRRASWILVLNLVLVVVSIPGGGIVLLVDRWFAYRKSLRSSSHMAVTG